MPVAAQPERGKSEPPTGSAYGIEFWLCYLSNTAFMVSISLLFRYSDFVMEYLGGQQWELGLIVGVGMVGAVAMRIVQGVGIDRYGPRTVWLISIVLFVVSIVLHLAVTSAHTAPIYLVRMLMTTSIAGTFGASITYISLRVPERRMAEMIGTLGTSGFLGMAVGPALGDALFAGKAVSAEIVRNMFLLSAGMGLVSLVSAVAATWGHTPTPSRRPPPFWSVVRRYHPGVTLLVGAAMGISVGLPHIFLRAYTAELNIQNIKVFFLVYAATAFAVRMGTRRVTEHVGYRQVVLAGLGFATLSMLLYLLVNRSWQLAIPAAAAGTAHAFLFPSVVASGSITFPVRYRGLATTLMLAMFDVGNLVGQPTVGGLLWASETLGWPAYPTMFLCMAVGLTIVSVVYWALATEPGQRRATGGSATARRDSASPSRGRVRQESSK